MAQASYPFDNIDVTETQFSYWAKNLSGNGYGGVMGYPGDTQLQVNTSASGLVVTVNPGYAIVRGFAYSNDATVTLTLNTATQNRYDRIILRLDTTANSIVLAVVTGTGATTPSLPSLTQTDTGIYEMELANIYIPAGAVLSTAGTLVDTRTYLGEQVGKWTTNGRPAGPWVGRMGWNSTLQRMEYWSGSTWTPSNYMTWTTANRPTSPIVGTMGYNSDLLTMEVWNGTAWTPPVSVTIIDPFLLMGA